MASTSHRDGFLFKGAPSLYIIDWAAEARRHGEMPPCAHLEHRHGVCPLGITHGVEDHHLRNQVVDLWYTSVLDQLVGAAGAVSLAGAYVAAGTGGSPTTDGMTGLEVEVYRDIYTERVRSGNTATISWFYGQDVAPYYLHEWGVFIGAATATAGSGRLAARFQFDFDKSVGLRALYGDWLLSKA